MLYPLKFKPLFKYRIWGGEKLKNYLNKKYEATSIGESWEISSVKGNETLVANGSLKNKNLEELISTYKADLVGKEVFETFGTSFPLLIKFIDAKKDLSIQVHPNNEVAKTKHNSFGKNEMWYVMQADENAKITLGFKEQLSSKSYQHHLKNKTLLEVLHTENTKEGDVFYIPTGRVHAIGSGILLAEIQQTSDVTYRIYDYNRVDAKTGKKRVLHNDLAIDVIDFSVKDAYKTLYEKKPNKSNIVLQTPYFKTNIIPITKTVTLDYSKKDAFAILMCVAGSATIENNDTNYSLALGETILLPAITKKVTIRAEKAILLEITY